MTAENILGIVCIVLVVILQLVCKWKSENVYLKYKEQKVGVRTKWWRR